MNYYAATKSYFQEYLIRLENSQNFMLNKGAKYETVYIILIL